MKNRTAKKLKKVEEFLELIDSYGLEATISVSVYGNKYRKIIKDANKLFSGKLSAEDDGFPPTQWRRWHNASKGEGFTNSNLRFAIFYPKNVIKI